LHDGTPSRLSMKIGHGLFSEAAGIVRELTVVERFERLWKKATAEDRDAIRALIDSNRGKWNRHGALASRAEKSMHDLHGSH
jgi:hypothetical protein